MAGITSQATTPSGEQLVILLNETFLPPTIFSDKNLIFGTPSPAPDGSVGFDTVCDVTGVPGKGYYGDATIQYTRVPLSNIGSPQIYSLDNYTLDTVAALLNAAYGTFLVAADFVPQDITTPPLLGSATITLVAASTSLGWEGQVDVIITHDKPHLNNVITSNGLAVLTDNLSQKNWNGRDYLWTYDFTSLRDAIKVVNYQYALNSFYAGLADFGTLQTVCTKLGIPYFPPPYVQQQCSDYATSQISDSNPNFDRVMIMGPVQGGTFYRSNLYFHYNVLENR